MKTVLFFANLWNMSCMFFPQNSCFMLSIYISIYLYINNSTFESHHYSWDQILIIGLGIERLVIKWTVCGFAIPHWWVIGESFIIAKIVYVEDMASVKTQKKGMGERVWNKRGKERERVTQPDWSAEKGGKWLNKEESEGEREGVCCWGCSCHVLLSRCFLLPPSAPLPASLVVVTLT